MATHGTRRYLTRSCGQTGTGYGAALDDGQLCTLHVLALVSRVVSLVEVRAQALPVWCRVAIPASDRNAETLLKQLQVTGVSAG